MGGQPGKRKSYRIDLETAHRRSALGGQARTTTDYFVRKIVEHAGALTSEQKRRLVTALLADDGPPGDAGGEAA
jgi:predicted DNA-binding protein